MGPASEAGDETTELVRDGRLTTCSFQASSVFDGDDVEAYVHLVDPAELFTDNGAHVNEVNGGTEYVD